MSYLFRRNGIYYFRLVIPADRRHLFDGKREIRRSLSTYNKQSAIITAAGLLHMTKRKIYQKDIDALHTAIQKHKDMEGKFDPDLRFYTLKLKDGRELTIDTGDDDKDFEAAQKLLESTATTQPATEDAPPLEGAPLMSSLIVKYCEVKAKGNRWVKKTAEENKVIFNLFLEIVGDMPITKFAEEKRHARRYAEFLQILPPNRKKSPVWRDYSVEEIYEKKPKKTISVSTINRYVGCISGFMAWCIRQDYIAVNRMKGKTVEETRRADKQRDIFTEEDLRKIFSPMKKYFHPYYKWLPLMALYTGARIEELCSLYLKDIKQVNGVWVFDINENADDKRLKNEHSERITPIHSELTNKGFLEFVDSVKSERLFPELKRIREKYSHYAGGWFNDRRMPKLGITGNKSFHSFRHTFITQAHNQARLDRAIIRQMVGQRDKSMLGRYAKRFPPETLKTEIEKVKFDI